jgi:hypothetical protein
LSASSSAPEEERPLEEGTAAAWLYDLLKPHVARLLVCNPRRNALLKVGNKSDRIDARKLIEFVSFSEQMDTSTPSGKMVFTVLGAVAELERSLIVERVKAGLRNAKAKGKQLGRPKRVVDARKLAGLRAQGFGWKKISRELGIGVGTLYRLAAEGSKIREKVF